MKKDVQLVLQKLNKNHRYKMIWYRVVSILACITVFITTYALILPAITMESASDEEIRELLYSNNKVLRCPLEVHQHTAECYDEDNNLICGCADYVVHKHDMNCYGADGELVCRLEQVEEHVHDLSCENEQHEITCEKNEITLHKHSSDCYDEEGKLICGMLEVTEHIHTIDCFKMPSVEFSEDYDGLSIRLNADEGVFPVVSAPLNLKVSEAPDKIKKALESRLNGTFVYKIVDLCVTAGENVVYPSEEISVSFNNIDTQIDMNSAIVCRVASEGEEKQLVLTQADENGVTVNTRFLGTFVVASPSYKSEIINEYFRSEDNTTSAESVKYYTDRSGDIGVLSEGYDDSTANLSINVNDYLKRNIGQYVSNSQERIGGTIYLTQSWKAFINEQDWDGNAPFRITGIGNTSGGNVIEAAVNDFRLENGSPDEEFVPPAPANPVKFDNLTYQSRLSSMNFWARGNKFVIGENIVTLPHGVIVVDTVYRIFGGAEHQTVFTREPKTTYPTNIVIESAHWDEVFGGGMANTAYGTNVTVRGTADITYLAGGGDDECQVAVYDQDDTKGDASLKGVGVNVYLENGNVETLYGGSRVTPAETLAFFDQKALNIYTPVTINIGSERVGDTQHADYVYGMNDFTAFGVSADNISNYIRNSFIYADSTINLFSENCADYVVGDLYRNSPVSSTNQRHVLGTTRVNITASNSFERLNYFDVINITGQDVVVSSNESIGGSMTDSNYHVFGPNFDGYVGQIAVTNGAKLVLDHPAIINNYYNNPNKGNIRYKETDRAIKANSYDDPYYLSHSWVGEYSEDRRNLSIISINGQNTGISKASGTTFNESTDTCGLLIHGTVRGNLGDSNIQEGYSILEADGTPIYSNDKDYYYYIVADSSLNGGKAFREPEGEPYIVCYRYLDNGKIGWYLRERPQITMSNKLVRAGDTDNGKMSVHVVMNGLAYEWSNASSSNTVDLQWTKTIGTDGSDLTTVTESLSLSDLSNIENDTTGRFSNVVIDTVNGVKYLRSFDYVIDESTPTEPTYYEAEVDYHVVRNDGDTTYEDIHKADGANGARCIYDFAGNDTCHANEGYTNSVMDTFPYTTPPEGQDTALLRVYLPNCVTGKFAIAEDDNHFLFTDDTSINAQLVQSSVISANYGSANSSVANSQFAVTIGGSELSQGISNKTLSDEITRYVCKVYSYKDITVEDISQNTASGLKLNLQVSDLTKDGSAVGDNAPTAVNNGELQIQTLPSTVSLIITKQVLNSPTSGAFPFSVRIKDSSNDPIILDRAAIIENAGINNNVAIGQDGEISFTLENNQSIRLTGIPIGSVFTLSETQHTDYTVVITENDTPILQGDTLTGSRLDRTRRIVVCNYGEYNLPGTGKGGIYNYIVFGIALMTIPIIIGFVLRHSIKRRVVKE